MRSTNFIVVKDVKKENVNSKKYFDKMLDIIDNDDLDIYVIIYHKFIRVKKSISKNLKAFKN